MELYYILNALELNLCLQIYGKKASKDYPMHQTPEPVEQRVMNGIFHLTQIGALQMSGDRGYRLSADIEAFVGIISNRQVKRTVFFQNGQIIQIYPFDDNDCVIVEQIREQADGYRIAKVSKTEAATLVLDNAAINSIVEIEDTPRENFTIHSMPLLILKASKVMIVTQTANPILPINYIRLFQCNGANWLSVIDENPKRSCVLPFRGIQDLIPFI